VLRQVAKLAAKQLVQVAQLAELVHSLVQKFVEQQVQKLVEQQVQNSELAQILELEVFHLLVHQLQVSLLKTGVLVSMF
jgi:hypothetical protein